MTLSQVKLCTVLNTDTVHNFNVPYIKFGKIIIVQFIVGNETTEKQEAQQLSYECVPKIHI